MMADSNSKKKKLETGFASTEVDDDGIIHVTGKEGADVTKENFELLDEWMKSLNLKKLIVFADRLTAILTPLMHKNFMDKRKYYCAGYVCYITS